MGSGAQAFATQYPLAALSHSWPVGDLVGSASRWLFVVGLSVPFEFTLLLFPTGRLVSSRWRPVAWFCAIWAGIYAALLAFNPEPDPQLLVPANPFGVEALQPFIGPALTVAAACGALAVAFGLVSLVLRFRRARGDERQQLRWLAFGTAVWVAILATSAEVVQLGFATPQLQLVRRAVESVALQAVPVAIGIAILRYRLYDIDILIRRTLVYGALSATLAGLYWVGVVVFEHLARPFTQGSDLGIMASTVAIAAVFQPLRRWIQQLVDRRFYRARHDSQRTLDAFAVRARDQIDLEEMTTELLSVVQRNFQPASVRLWLRRRFRNDV
jgi:hypothetical protein